MTAYRVPAPPIAPVSLVLALTLAAAGCASGQGSRGEPATRASAAERSPGEKAERREDKAAELAGARRELELAEAAIEVAELEADSKLRAKEEARRAKAAALEEARRADETFRSESDLMVRRSELALARAENQLVVARADLAGIERIYAEEEEARAAEEIIRRHRTSVQFAEADLLLRQSELEQLRANTLVKQQRELAEKVLAAEFALDEAEREVALARREADLELDRKRDAAEDARQKARVAERALREWDEGGGAAKAGDGGRAGS